MDPVLLHIRVNHFPIVLALLGTAAMVVALISKRTLWLRYAQITLILAGISAPVAYFSGDEALDQLRDQKTWYIDKHQTHDHEEAGEKATIAIVITGLLAAASLWKDRKALQILVLVGALASAALVSFAGLEGGKIVHENPRLQAGPK